MLFIIGISPKIKIIDQNARRCPVCGLHQAYSRRIDHYFQIFFIPVARVKKGEPFVLCERCYRTKDEFSREFSPSQEKSGLLCKFCGNPIRKEFYYCPYCGKKI
ncbi:MAG: zinc ribbon domain-containing protein [Desulfobacterales bacterium]